MTPISAPIFDDRPLMSLLMVVVLAKLLSVGGVDDVVVVIAAVDCASILLASEGHVLLAPSAHPCGPQNNVEADKMSTSFDGPYLRCSFACQL